MDTFTDEADQNEENLNDWVWVFNMVYIMKIVIDPLFAFLNTLYTLLEHSESPYQIYNNNITNNLQSTMNFCKIK